MEFKTKKDLIDFNKKIKDSRNNCEKFELMGRFQSLMRFTKLSTNEVIFKVFTPQMMKQFDSFSEFLEKCPFVIGCAIKENIEKHHILDCFVGMYLFKARRSE